MEEAAAETEEAAVPTIAVTVAVIVRLTFLVAELLLVKWRIARRLGNTLVL